jgi:hypothetical protein
MREVGDLIGTRGEAKTEQVHRIDHTGFSRPRFILSKTWGRKDDVGSDAIVGTTCQRGKRKRGVPVRERGRDGPWAVF